MEITIRNQQKRIPLNLPKIKKITQKVLKNEGIRDGSLSLVFVTDQRIKSLNKKYLNRDYATDVLAFDLKDDQSLDTKRSKKVKSLEGEIIISTVMACRNAKVYEATPQKEIVLYIIHGILHLMGYDDHKPSDVKKMRKKESELVKVLETSKI